MISPAFWFQHLPLYIQVILALVMSDWLFFQCWFAQRVLMEVADELPDA